MNPSDYSAEELKHHAIDMQRGMGYILADPRPIEGSPECLAVSTMGEYVISLPAERVQEGDDVSEAWLTQYWQSVLDRKEQQ